MGKSKNYFLIISLIAVPVIIYFYFLKWRTNIIYGDDLFSYKAISTASSFSDLTKIYISSSKYRPVHELFSKLIFELFHKNIGYYYLFNVFIQTINTYLLALIIDLFLSSPVVSLFFSLIFALSRFAYFNLTQLFNGGVLEGLAMTFFLLALFFIIRSVLNDRQTNSQKYREWFLSILFANLCMYTHERYIILFAFIILLVIFFPGIRTLGNRRRVIVILAALLSIIMNGVIKKYGYSMPLFVGTGNTDISFSFPVAKAFFKDAVLSIFQVNTGPEYLVGIQYSSLPPHERKAILLLICCFFILLLSYLFNAIRYFVLKDEIQKKKFFIFLSLCCLFGFCLAPAVVTIRLEQRWLQASLSVFILLSAIAFNSIRFKNDLLSMLSCLAFVLLFLWTDHNYLEKGGSTIYLSSTEKLAADFKQAIDKGIIRPNTTELYIIEKKKDANAENEVNWALGAGYFFRFYQNETAKIIFTDTASTNHGALNLNKDFVQIVYINSGVIDITNQYLQDSLKNFKY